RRALLVLRGVRGPARRRGAPRGGARRAARARPRQSGPSPRAGRAGGRWNRSARRRAGGERPPSSGARALGDRRDARRPRAARHPAGGPAPLGRDPLLLRAGALPAPEPRRAGGRLLRRRIGRSRDELGDRQHHLERRGGRGLHRARGAALDVSRSRGWRRRHRQLSLRAQPSAGCSLIDRMSDPALTPSQVEQFITSGFVRLDGAFPAALADEGRAILWRDTGCDPNDPATWTRPVVRLGGYADPPFVRAANTPLLHAAFDQLVGPGRWAKLGGLGTFPVRFPSSEPP